MPTSTRRRASGARPSLLIACALAALALGTGCAGVLAAEEEASPAASDWQHWHANNNLRNVASLQRGARNFMSFCSGCHSLKYERYSRLGQDLEIPAELLQNIVPAGVKPTQYILTTMPAADAEAWFGKTPPDLSLMARERGTDYLFQFMKTFYVDPSRQTGANNLRLPSTAMPDVVSALEGLKQPVYRTLEKHGADGKVTTEQIFDHFQQLAPGQLSPAEYDEFVRDTVNFLDYVGEPAQVQRRALGVWVVLFLLVFTWLAWLMKREYWKDVH